MAVLARQGRTVGEYVIPNGQKMLRPRHKIWPKLAGATCVE